jgi:hypothetical protein
MILFTKTNDYQELCDRNKNVTKMGVIMRVYSNWVLKMEYPTYFGGA